MKLEILRTYITLEATDHRTKPKYMSVGGFSISLDNVNIIYDNYELSGDWSDGFLGPKENCKIIPTIDCLCRGGAAVYYIGDEQIESPEHHTIDVFEELPQITSLDEIAYQAYTNLEEGIEFEFHPTRFIIDVVDRETKESYRIKASPDVLKEYKNKLKEIVFV